MKKHRKTMTIFTLLLAALLLLTACKGSPEETAANGATNGGGAADPWLTQGTAVWEEPEELPPSPVVDLDKIEGNLITFEGEKISFTGQGAVADGNVITVTEPGVYYVTGSSEDAQLLVSLSKDEEAELILCGVSLASKTSAPLWIVSAGKVTVTLAAETENVLSDGEEYVYPDGETAEPNAALFSKDDLTIDGTGSLTVYGNYHNGIGCKDDLKIKSGNITVTAKNHAIRGNDSVTVSRGKLTLTAGGDGIKSTNEEEEEKGYVRIDAGTITVTAAGDGISGARNVLIGGGNITITCGGGAGEGKTASGGMRPGYQQKPADAVSSKGIKASAGILLINNGNLILDTADDALHSNNDITVAGGIVTLKTGDDGLHADETLSVLGGKILVTQSYEGLEAKKILISGGEISVTASDDGINASDGSGGGFGGPGGRPGGDFGGRPGGGAVDNDILIDISGGVIYVNAQGDGVDSNGNIKMSGGILLVDGPTGGGDGALDYEGTFDISGGILAAAGSVGMAESISSTSAQYGVMVYANGSAGALIRVEDKDGNGILTYQPSKQFGCIVISTPEIRRGESYTVYGGGSYSGGNAVYGYLYGGDYTAGTEIGTFTTDSVSSTVGAGGGGFGGDHGRGPGARR